MSNIVAIDFKKIEEVMIHGDLSKLSSQEKVGYYNKVCESVGLNPLTKPFDYIRLNGREVLYAKRDAGDQLRRLHGISIKITSKEVVNDLFVVCAKACDKDGREDEAIGAVSIVSLKGEALANAYMKAETKAKRRVTLSICGLGLMDESEIEGAQASERDATVKELTVQVQDTAAAPEFESADYFDPGDDKPAKEDLGEFVFPCGKKHKGKKLKAIKIKELEQFVNWADGAENSTEGIHPTVAQCRDKVREYLIQLEEQKK